MTKISIDISKNNLDNYSILYTKVKRAFEEAEAKEIKEGDWVMNTNSIKVFIADSTSYIPAVKKLPQNLQDGLNEFIRGLNDKTDS